MHPRRRILIVALVCGLSLVADSARAQTPLEQRADDIAALFRSDPGGYEAFFSEGFLAQVPPAQLTGIFIYYHTNYGAVVDWRLDELERPGVGAFTFITDKGYSIASRLTVGHDPPHLLDGLWFDNGVRMAASFEEVVAELDSLPGTVSFLLTRLDDEAATALASLNPDHQLAIGSAFKLYILATLIQTIEDGERAWTDIVALEAEAVSLPSGRLHAWPVGAPLTLHTLATQMISESAALQARENGLNNDTQAGTDLVREHMEQIISKIPEMISESVSLSVARTLQAVGVVPKIEDAKDITGIVDADDDDYSWADADGEDSPTPE